MDKLQGLDVRDLGSNPSSELFLNIFLVLKIVDKTYLRLEKQLSLQKCCEVSQNEHQKLGEACQKS